jgi:hypothetical protein
MNIRMNGRITLTLASTLLFVFVQMLEGQNTERKGAELHLEGVESIPQVYVALELRASGQ